MPKEKINNTKECTRRYLREAFKIRKRLYLFVLVRRNRQISDLILSVSAIGIKPSEKDKLKFSSSKDELLEEDSLRSYNPEEQLVSRNIEIDFNGNPSKDWRDDKEELVSKLAQLEARLLQEKTNEEEKLDRILKEKEVEKEEMKDMFLAQGLIILFIGSLAAFAVIFYIHKRK